MNIICLCALWGILVGLSGGFFRVPLWLVLIAAALGAAVIATPSHAGLPVYTQNLRANTVRVAVGTASIVEGSSGKRYILTNFHVCIADTWKGTLNAFRPDGTLIPGRVVKRAPAIDLCAAEIEKEGRALHLGRQPAPFADVYTRGYPGGILVENHGNLGAYSDWKYEFAIGDIGECPKEFTREVGPDGLLDGCSYVFHSLLTSLYSRPGSSGSPVVDNDGNLVGVISSWHPGSPFEAGIVTYDQLKSFLESL